MMTVRVSSLTRASYPRNYILNIKTQSMSFDNAHGLKHKH